MKCLFNNQNWNSVDPSNVFWISQLPKMAIGPSKTKKRLFRPIPAWIFYETGQDRLCGIDHVLFWIMLLVMMENSSFLVCL